MMSSQASQTSGSQKPRKTTKTKAGKHSNKKNQETFICVTCNDKITDEERSMMCDFCHHYTHVSCDEKLSDDLCDCLDENEGNSMIYLCGECRPMLIPKSSDHLFDGIIKKMEKVLNDPSRKNLAETIMNRMSGQVRELDQMMLDHKANMTQTQTELRKLVTDTMSDSTTMCQRASVNVKDLELMLVEQRDRICKTDVEVNKLLEAVQEYHNSKTTEHNAAFPRDIGSECTSLNQQSYQTNPPYSAWHKPPDMSRPPPPMNHIPPNLYRGPPLSSSHKQPTKWDFQPDMSLVVYNLANNMSVTEIVEQLILRCNIYPNEITFAERRHSNTSHSAPLFMQCHSKSVKWNLIVSINKFRHETSTDWKDSYARPYLNEEELKQDRALVRKLTHIRSKFKERSFKIRRGIIYELINERETIYEEEADATRMENNGLAGDPAIDDPVLEITEGNQGAIQELPNQTTPLTNEGTAEHKDTTTQEDEPDQ